MLDGYFRKPNNPPGKKFPAVIAFQGADTMADGGPIMGGGAYAARGWRIWQSISPARERRCDLKDLHLPRTRKRVGQGHDR